MLVTLKTALKNLIATSKTVKPQPKFCSTIVYWYFSKNTVMESSNITFRLLKVSVLLLGICCGTWPSSWKIESKGSSIPKISDLLLLFNDPSRHKHKCEQVNKEVLLKYLSEVTNRLKKSFANQNSFSKLYEVIDHLVESIAKYSDYLEQNLKSVNKYQSLEEPLEVTNITALPYQSDSSFSKLYSSKC